MPLPTDALPQLVDAVRGDFDARLPGADTRTRRSPLDVLARALGAVHRAIQSWVQWVARQIHVQTADIDTLRTRHGPLWGIKPNAASYASGTLMATGIAGRLIAADTRWRRADGAEYTADADVVIGDDGTAAVPVVAAAAGAAGNTAAGLPLTLVAPIDGVALQATVGASGLAGGADEEGADSHRARILARVQQPPHGGAQHDYEAWAREVAGVTRAWVFPLESGPGTVAVRFMMDGTYPDGIPQAGDIALMQAYLDDPTRRPVTAVVTAGAAAAVPLDPHITLTPDTADVRAAVEAELRDLILREGAPDSTLLISHVQEAISIAAGETDHVLTAPTANQTYASTQIPVLGTITWGA